MSATLQPGTGPITADATCRRRRPPCSGADCPARPTSPCCASRDGTEVTIDTGRHEGLLADQGSDPLAYFTGHGIAPADVLTDAIEIVATMTREAGDGPHIVTGPIFVEGAMPGDLLAITVLETTPARPVRRHLQPARPRRAGGRAAARRRRGRASSRRSSTGHGLLPVVEGGERAASRSRSPRSSGSWASRWPGASGRTRSRPARTAATSTSTCCRSAPRSTCPCRCRARSRTSATRTSRRATGRSR